MRIGILTFHNADNYGAVLQCYALQETLKKKYPDEEVYVIDYKCPVIENSYIPHINFKRPWSILTYFKAKKKRKRFEKFRQKYFNLGLSDFSIYDIIYYGSDQIWNPVLTNHDLTYFGKGYNGIKIAYAASDGDAMDYDSEVCKLLNSFSKISCREKTMTGKIQNAKINLPIESICDPVFLLSRNEWMKIAKKPKEKNYVLVYKIRENLNFDKEAEKLGDIFNKKIIQIVYVKPLRKFFYKEQTFVECITPEQFVGYFAYTDFVLTTSFHGTAFSIIFDKAFYVLEIDNASKRITDLLSELNISDRYGIAVKTDKQIIHNFESYKQKAYNFLCSVQY